MGVGPGLALLARLEDEGAGPDSSVASRLGMRVNTFLQNITRARRQLARLQQEIAALSEELRADLAQRSSLRDALRESEVAIGVEMFSQMTVGSPMAMAAIFTLMMLFFRKWRLVILPMRTASVFWS